MILIIHKREELMLALQAIEPYKPLAEGKILIHIQTDIYDTFADDSEAIKALEEFKNKLAQRNDADQFEIVYHDYEDALDDFIRLHKLSRPPSIMIFSL